MIKAGILVSLLGMVASAAFADTNWKEGENYFRLQPAQPTSVAAGKIEVVEVFSYACPACNMFYPTINKLKAALPARVQWRFVPASWHVEEDWKVFQRAYFAADSLGIAERTHDKVFDAIWKTGELAIMDYSTHQMKDPLPSLADVAKWYEGVAKLKPGEFLAASHSFSVDAHMREADAQIHAYQVDGTPSVVVNGKYRVTPSSAGGNDQFIALVQWLVKQESK
jgi:protein dithiol oxidoreductase (disulfide-forming)